MAFYPATEPRDTLEFLYAEQGPRRPLISWCLLAFVLLSGSALPFIQVDVSVRGRGIVVPDPIAAPGFPDQAPASPHSQIRIEAYLPERDLTLLRAGQPAVIQYDAYPYPEWTGVPGTVVAVSTEPVPGAAQALFKVVIGAAAGAYPRAEGRAGTIAEGMTAGVRFIVNRKSLLQLISQRSAAPAEAPLSE
ncbi:MAG TPA: HlyD family efflux transporter periplasmic adaptor subunit [Opitutaceae bacterium]|nr:HlyD family efflux transporter periplasmic adaptor subunit [Opitutaceae bacterium]